MSDTDRRKLQLEASLDASGVREGAAEAVSAARTMAAGVEAAGRQGAAGLAPLEAKAGTAAAAMSRSERSMVQSVQRATAAMQAGGTAGSEYYEILAKQRGLSGDVLKPYIAQLREAEAAQRRLNQTTGMSDRATAAAMRGVPAQFTDILVSLQGGQAPLTVFLQQGGQLKDMFGGAGNAAKALGGYVLGLVNPFTLAAAAAGVLALAYYQGTKEADEYAKAIIMTGNAAGTTTGQLAAMAQELDDRGFTQGAAAAALAEVASTGYVAAGSIQLVAEAALRMEREAGIPIENTVKSFAELGKSPVEASLKLTEQHRYLTAEIYQQIKALADQGRESEAAQLAQETYADALMKRSGQLQERLGFVERAWRGIKNAAKEAWDAMLDIDRPETKQNQLRKLEEQMATRMAQAGTVGNDAAWQAGNQRLQRRIDALKSALKDENAAALGQADNQEREQARINWMKDGEKYLSKSAKLELELAKARAEGVAAGASQEEIEKRLADIRDKRKTKGGTGIDAANRRLDLTEIQRAARDELSGIDQQQRAIDLRRQAGLMAESDYYDQKRVLIVKANDTEEAALREQIARLEQEKTKGKDALEVQKQLVEARSKLKIKEAEGQNKLNAVSQEAAAAAARQDAALQSLTSTHARYLQQLDLQASRAVSSAWMGEKDRQRAEGQWSIEDRYLAEERRLKDQQMFTVGMSPEQSAQIELRLQQLQTEKSRELQLYKQTYQQLDQMQSQWQLGGGQAMQNYLDQSVNVAGHVGSAFTRAFQGMEDALINFAMTGKLSFKDLANSIIADIVRAQARAAVSGLFGNIMGAIGLGTTSVAGASLGSGFVRDVGLDAAGLVGMSSGGYTGDGGKYEPAGIVHRGEYVINAASTRKLGLGYLNSLNGYANGGLVGGGSSPHIPAPEVHIHNHAGAPVEQSSRRGAGGQEIIDVFIGKAVSAVAGQLATDSGEVGRAMRSRSKMGM
ncbi:phage tail tape measure protein [Comamonas antarctica]|uniref:phage tail tape measure protein n=1 Tax=Comamonas antarctica TaxID=2743470 RepID=UPI0028E1D04B|nr:phage tail tape measure protein [Comamonas antarctica]